MQIDRLFEWKANMKADVRDTLKKQQRNTKLEFEERVNEVVVQFAEQVSDLLAPICLLRVLLLN